MAKQKFNSMYQKKSQATIFMVISLVIIIGGIIFFYSTQKVSKPIEPEIKIIEEQIPIEFDPIKKYANDCVYSTSVEALKIIGEQGGYISFTDRALNREPFIITQNPTESDAIFFTKDSDLIVPYWWYLKSANNCEGNCKFASKRPELRQTDNSIEKQLERYINSKFEECLNDFEPFVEQGFNIVKATKPRSDVTIASEDILVLIEYPISAERQDAKTRLSQFFVRIPVDLNKIYDLATKITNFEIKHRYLEKHVLNLLVTFSGVDKEKLPPMSDMQFKFGSTISWQKSDIKNKLTGLLLAYIPLFQTDGTYNYNRNIFDSELKQRLYDSTIIPVANSSFRNLETYFTYLDFWPIYFDLNCRGERCIPSSANSLISFFGIQDYRFAYDLSYPVLVEVKDPFALDNQGYSFNFFLEGNIRNNKPMPVDFAPLERASLSESSLICDVRTSGNITINVVEPTSKKAVDDAQILYTVTDESCFMGSTNSHGILTEKFPIGIGGVINVLKDKYIGKAVEFDPKVNKDGTLKVELQPIFTKNLLIKKKNVVKTSEGWQFVNTPVDLNEKETATATLTRINDEDELEFSSIANYEGQQKEPSNASELPASLRAGSQTSRSETRSQLTEIEIAAGKYSADITLMLNERIIIPEKQKCVRKGIFGEKECYTIPEIDFGEKSSAGQERFPEGGLKLNFTVESADISNFDTIVLYVVSIDLANVPEQERVVEDLEQMGKIEDYSNTYQLALQPDFQ